MKDLCAKKEVVHTLSKAPFPSNTIQALSVKASNEEIIDDNKSSLLHRASMLALPSEKAVWATRALHILLDQSSTLKVLSSWDAQITCRCSFEQ